MAKKDKVQSQISTVDKKTTLGESIKQLEEKEMAQQKFIADMNEYLESTIVRAVNHNGK